MFPQNFDSNQNIIQNRRGQILVEYLLLMVIAVGCATILINGLIGRGSSPGIIIKQWNKILIVIGNDLPDCSKQTNFSGTGPRCPP